MTDTAPSEDTTITSTRRVVDLNTAALAVLAVQDLSATDWMGVGNAIEPGVVPDIAEYLTAEGPSAPDRSVVPDDVPPPDAPADRGKPGVPGSAPTEALGSVLAAPRDISLDGVSLNGGNGMHAGLAVDDDMGDTHRFSVADPRFEVVNGELRLAPNASLDGSDGGLVSFVITVTDQHGDSAPFAVNLAVSSVGAAPEPVIPAPLPFGDHAVIDPSMFINAGLTGLDAAILSDTGFAFISQMLALTDDRNLPAASAPTDDQSPDTVPGPTGDQSLGAGTGPADDQALNTVPAPTDEQSLNVAAGPTDDPGSNVETQPTGDQSPNADTTDPSSA